MPVFRSADRAIFDARIYAKLLHQKAAIFCVIARLVTHMSQRGDHYVVCDPGLSILNVSH